MCAKLSSFPSDLVAYFNFDDAGTTTVKDLSSQKLNGTLQNMNSSTAWVSSGAPIGDRSVYRYTNKWDSSLEMVTDYANFSVIRVDPAIQGFHLYSIQSPPASTRGINSPQEVKEYYGLFKVGDASKKHKVYFKQYGMACGANLYRRPDNTVANWNQVADTTASPIMLYNTSANYGEFAATSKAAPTVKINGSTKICAGETSTLHVSNLSTEKVLWNTGETSSSIKVTKSGTYSVEVTNATGCTARDEVQVNFTKEPVIPLPVEVFTCYGETVVLDATAEGASYSWSSGQSTPGIAVNTPGTYVVTITVNDCHYVRQVLVSNDECPEIPNIITPNDDGKNDTFVVQGVAQNSLDLKVFNRWGKSIYQNERYDNSWSASAVPAGIYFYQLTSGRTQKVYKGWVEVVR